MHSFETNNTITKVKYSDGLVEEFACERLINSNRCNQEFDDAKNAFCSKHEPIQSEEVVIRYGIANPGNFFNFLYYTWSQPSQIKYGIATLKVKGTYVYKSNEHIDSI